MFCSNCGAKVPDNAKFCFNCGKPISENLDLLQQKENLPLAQENSVMPEVSSREVNNPIMDPVKQTVVENQISNESEAAKNTEHDESAIKKIVQKNTDYYIKEFCIYESSRQCKLNKAAFFLSPAHAAYRGTLREWLKFVQIPLLCMAIGMIAAMVSMFQFFNFQMSLFCFLISGVSEIALLISSFRYAKKFNVLYMAHVNEKISRNDFTPDPSVKRVVVTCLIVGLLSGDLAFACNKALFPFDMSSDISDYEDDSAVYDDDNVIDEFERRLEADDYIMVVRAKPLDAYPELNYGVSFDNFFGDSTWNYFKSKDEETEEDIDIVEFSGSFLYQDVSTNALIRFSVDKENKIFEPVFLSFDDVPQDQSVYEALVEKVIEQAAIDWGISSASESESTGTNKSQQSQNIGTEKDEYTEIDIWDYTGEWISIFSTTEVTLVSKITIFEANSTYFLSGEFEVGGGRAVFIDPVVLEVSGNEVTAQGEDSWGSLFIMTLTFDSDYMYVNCICDGNAGELNMENEKFSYSGDVQYTE